MMNSTYAKNIEDYLLFVELYLTDLLRVLFCGNTYRESGIFHRTTAASLASITTDVFKFLGKSEHVTSLGNGIPTSR